jgi:glycosyltransferase 2 family protein
MPQKNNQEEIITRKHVRKIIYPIIIGIGVVVFLLQREVDVDMFSVISFTWYSAFWISVAFMMMVIRDLGYMVRLRILTEGEFTWRQCFNVVMLWEFSSAITPSAIGGTGIAIFFVNREGLSIGRSTAVVMATSFLDELYFILMFPVLFLVVTGNVLFSIGVEPGEEAMSFTNEFFYFAVIGYFVKLVFVLLVAYGLFINPRGLKWLLLWIFRLPIIRKWRYKMKETGTDLIETSRTFKSKPFKFWLKVFVATIFSWTARYWVVNFLLLAFFYNVMAFDTFDHILIFARQLVMWIMMLVSPTPGGSGFAEFVFSRYLGDFIPLGFAVMMALVWRLISYYPYLFIGAVMLPQWLAGKITYGKKQKISKDSISTKPDHPG